MTKTFYLLGWAILLSLTYSSTAVAQVSCVDCPNFNYELNPQAGIATMYTSIEVTTTGMDDLSVNPLTGVRINLAHGWLNDVYISLISPSGLHYVLMGDEDNMAGGCTGQTAAYADITLVPGNSNPLTPGVPYHFLCNGGQSCLEGNFNLACGQSATDFYNGAMPAPNCDLSDYNEAGHTVSGTWTLLVNCVCPQLESNQGYPLLDWGLDFVAPSTIAGGIGCLADGGIFADFEFQNCEDDSFNYPITPSFQNGIGAPTHAYSHQTFLVQDDVIIEKGPNFNQDGTLHAGFYDIKAISYHNPNLSLDVVGNFVGHTVNEMTAYLATSGLCYDWMQTSSTLEILPVIEPIYMSKILCDGECIDVLGTTICEAGDYELIQAGANMCADITYLVSVSEADNETNASIAPVFCFGEILHLEANGGIAYEWTGPDGFTSNLANPVISVNSEDEIGVYQVKVTTAEDCIYTYDMDFSTNHCEEKTIHETVAIDALKTLCFDEIINVKIGKETGDQASLKYVIRDNCLHFSGAAEEGTQAIHLRIYEGDTPTYLTIMVHTISNQRLQTNQAGWNEWTAINQVNIFPNPSSDKVQIQTENLIKTIDILDINGRMIKSLQVGNHQTAISVSGLPVGIYWLKVNTEQERLMKKLIVF